ncbi:putative ATP-dependent endonuclease of the OLD family [Enhydrobacter aerosaccus]|uniref:Putative ATP-dependent endonuclease of the OLD family n=1 Tax=Enhydrobacter aerosaccus TaxID=225324 RepID=A0A1T4SA19_9HYPH|nr:AAA family ATPase [Enhydrobacter aerosaccus]SKA24738.1 putative ATP-dependent endonuclease of the OLD family [Enhydrobacter aerosaccus]
MRITRLKIENFRSIKNLDLTLGDTTVFIGQNNAGKTAILDAVRIVLTRRWGQRGTGFTEHDVHRPDEQGDPRTLPAVKIELVIEEPSVGAWNPDMVAALEDIMVLLPDGRNSLTLRVTCTWSEEKEAFEPAWQFLDAAGEPLPERRRATNLTGFFGYMPLFWLGALRDAADEFAPRSGHWGRLLRGVRIPDELEAEALRILAELDARIVAADPKLAQIADLIGEATRVAIGEGPGAARVNTLPMAIEEMLQRTGIVLRNENLRPWLPLGHHGQGLQSLAVIFLFQAAVLQQLAEAENPGVEAIFAIEEPEAHLHPQAARTLWERVQSLTGQKLMTTHSPYFVQQVPLRDLRLVKLRNGRTEFSYIPQRAVSSLPWTEALDGFTRGAHASKIFSKDAVTGCVAASSWFDEAMQEALANCYRREADAQAKTEAAAAFRYACRILPSGEDEAELTFHGRRVRGEIFFARRWILVEGVCEYLLIHALGRVMGWPLDDHGVSVIDFQLSGSAGIYPALGTAFQIPWHMIVDGDSKKDNFRKQILDRGFKEQDLTGRFITLTDGNDLEAELLACGHEQLLRDILHDSGVHSAQTCSVEVLRGVLDNRKTNYMSVLAARVAQDAALAARMPSQYVDLITGLRDGTV